MKMSRPVVVLAVVAALVGACSTESPAPTKDEVTFTASDAARSELGVERWKASLAENNIATIRGVTADDRELLRAHAGMRADGDVRRFRLDYERGEESVIVNAQSGGEEGQVTLQIERGGPEDAADIPRGFALLMADLAVAKPASASLAAGKLFGASLEGALRPLDGNPQLTDGCPLLHRCDGLSQTLNCGSAIYNLSDCSVKGPAKWLGKKVWQVIVWAGSLGRSAYDASHVIDCPFSIDEFFRDCMAYTGNGSTQSFGNGECGEGKVCDTDAPAPGQVTAGCASEGKPCIDHSEAGGHKPCASDEARFQWCCTGNGDSATNICGDWSCQKQHAGQTVGAGKPCCEGLVKNAAGKCVASCEQSGAFCNDDGACCPDLSCWNQKCTPRASACSKDGEVCGGSKGCCGGLVCENYQCIPR